MAGIYEITSSGTSLEVFYVKLMVESQKTSKLPCETHSKRVVTLHHESHVPEVDWGHAYDNGARGAYGTGI